MPLIRPPVVCVITHEAVETHEYSASKSKICLWNPIKQTLPRHLF
jgi:hypothetical protein